MKTVLTQATWESGSDSVTINIGHSKLVSILFPSTMTNTGKVTVSKSYDGTTFSELEGSDVGASLTASIKTGKEVYFSAGETAYLLDNYIRLTGAVNEGADRVIQFGIRQL